MILHKIENAQEELQNLGENSSSIISVSQDVGSVYLKGSLNM